ncbi:creD [Candida margitis]|uniref:creD n=1 Tax=Candida margitis TaxID=1775924 RepID=UPI002227F683|nr:creD [Candida margitis]KAI5953943.1 creD [Candida margitis]
MLKKQHNTSKSTSLFQVRLKNLEHDVLVLKGSAHEAASALLSGNIALSVNEPIHVKKVTLRLYANLKLRADLTSASSAAAGTSRKMLNFSKKVYEYDWDSNEFNQYFDHMYENSSSSVPHLSKNNSSTSLKGLRSRSGLNLSQLSQSSHSLLSSQSSSSTNVPRTTVSGGAGNHVLVQGNYEIPFSAILPGDMPESIEGLPGCSSVYKLEATIDRGKFHSTLVTKKHLRVVRTLTTDAVELSETIAVDNTWPKKVEYSLSCPTRALAIGSGTPISMMLVPLLKGLTLGEIKIQLVEFYSYVGNVPPMHQAERVIASKKIPKPDPDSFNMDKWEIETFLRIPASLSKCCQDVDLQSHVKVRHKLKFGIGLVNPDNHVSELRASLPVQLFISPFVTVSSKHDVDSVPNENNEEDILFTSDSYDQLSGLDNRANSSAANSASNSHTSLTGLVAPPVYDQHIYDRLWSDVSPIETPLTSGASTPRSRGGGYYGGDVGQFSMSPLDSNALSENLRQLSLQRQAQEAEAHSQSSRNGRATFNLDDEDSQQHSTPHSLPGNDYFTRGSGSLPRNRSFLQDHIMTPPVHLSRVNSDASVLNNSDMSRVPSYSQAMKSAASGDDDVSPAYEPPSPDSHFNLNEVNRNLLQNNQSSLLRPSLPQRGPSTPKAGARSPSNNTSPSVSRNVSSTSLSNLIPSRKSSNNLASSMGGNGSHSLRPAGGNNGVGSSSNSLSTSPVNIRASSPNNASEASNVSKLSRSASDRQAGAPMRTSSRNRPPSHFSSGEIPQTYNINSTTTGHSSPPPTPTTTATSPPSSTLQQPSTSNNHEGSIREVTGLLAMFALAYLAIDNYTERIKIEKLHHDTTAINLKALQVQQLNHAQERKKRDLVMLQERREVAKRDFKMGLHIAMLRKQLLDAGMKPVDLDDSIKEFEKSVKADNSIKNVTGQYLWLDDKSEFKPYLPDTMEYDKNRKSK